LSKVFYVYVDYTSTGRPFYVGYGDDERIENYTRNGYHAQVSKRFGRQREILLCTKDLAFVKQEEQRFIRELRTKRGEPGHWGANLTWGGDGCTGFVHSAESRLKNRLARVGKKQSPQQIEAAAAPKRGVPKSIEHRLAISQALLGQSHPWQKGKELSMSIRLKMSQGLRGKPKRCSECGTLGHNRRYCRQKAA
jgi:hypothetical protein